MESWKTSQLQRDAVTRRAQLDSLNASLATLETMLSEAQSFTGHYSERLAELERQIMLAGPMCSIVDGRSTKRPDVGTAERLEAERAALRRERDDEMARRTTTTPYGPKVIRFCELRPDDVIRRRGRLVTDRGAVQRALAEIEEQLTPGQLVQSGVPASDYQEHRQRVTDGRQRAGIGGAA